MTHTGQLQVDYAVVDDQVVHRYCGRLHTPIQPCIKRVAEAIAQQVGALEQLEPPDLGFMLLAQIRDISYIDLLQEKLIELAVELEEGEYSSGH